MSLRGPHPRKGLVHPQLMPCLMVLEQVVCISQRFGNVGMIYVLLGWGSIVWVLDLAYCMFLKCAHG